MKPNRRWIFVSAVLLILLFIGIFVVLQNTAPPLPPPADLATPTPTSASSNTPTGLSATAGNTTISLTWDVGDVVGYFVYRDDSAIPLNSEPLTTNAYFDIGLTNGKAYRYTVTAIDASGTQSPPSEVVEVTPRKD